jgi:hypothetical protein
MLQHNNFKNEQSCISLLYNCHMLSFDFATKSIILELCCQSSCTSLTFRDSIKISMKERQSQGKCGGRKSLLGYAPNPATQQNRTLSKITSWGVRVHWKKTDQKFRCPHKTTQHHYFPMTNTFRPVSPDSRNSALSKCI